jgi:hypothetical protein
MGIDLKVMASSFREVRNEMLPTATLRFERDAMFFSRMALDATPCLVRPLPAGMKVGVHEDAGLAWVEVDRYGRPLTFTTPADLGRLQLLDNLDPWNRAILTFLLALPREARLVLYWC